MQRALAALACAAAAAQLAGCGVAQPKEPPPKPFLGTRWEVVLDLPLAGEPPSFRFGDGRVEGFGGCNPVNARYIQDTVGAGAIAIGRIDTGRRSCDAAARATEERVLEVMKAASSYTIIGDTMTMSGSAGTLRLRAAAPEGGGAAAPGASTALLGTRWVAADGVADPRAAARLEFAPEGRLTGSTGCNSISGRWHVEGGEVRFSGLAVTKRMCLGEGAQVEERFLAAFSEESRGVREGDRLVVVSPSGARFAFAPVGSG